MNWKKYALLVLGLLLGLFLVSCGGTQSAGTPCPTAAPCPDCPPAPECPTAPEAAKAPYQDQWASSAHADATAEAFVHWNEDDPKEVPTGCAKCHSTPGYLDFLGADGSAAGTVDKGAPIGTVITCEACHNDAAAAHTSVVFPSGVEVTGLGPEARCMECHQGRASGPGVDAAITKAGVTDEDTPSDQLSFTNIHYFAAAATMYGGVVNGGYQYPGQQYDVKFTHVEGMDTCIDCHNQHTLEINIEKCGECHGVQTVEELRTIREPSSSQDYDGDGDTTEGIASEIEGLQGLLMQAIQAYGKEVAGTPIAYNPAAHPYFFIDTNGDGQISDDEAKSDNKYVSWTARLLKAAYNYQLSIKDPGAFAHNGKYIIELLFDSISDLNTKLSAPIDLSKANRIDSGHFAGSQMAFRDWDGEGEVPGSCAKCHSATGLHTFLANGVNVAAETSNGFMCSTCHDESNWPARYEVKSVTMPSGKVVSYGAEGAALDSNLCAVCHQARSAKKAVDAKIAQFKAADAPDTVVAPIVNADGSETKFSFINAHYLGIAAMWFGTDAQGFYEYEGKTYVGANPHMPVDGKPGCVGCHDVHSGAPKEELCAQCHGAVAVDDIRGASDTTDWNGNGDVAEGVRQEYRSMRDMLEAQIKVYAKETAGVGILYDSEAYPYWFVDDDGDGKADEKDGKPVTYSAWTPRLMKAAFNYNFMRKNQGAAVHNAKYAMQILFDSIEDLGGDVSKLVRP